MNKVFKGCGTALLTPFKNGEVDYNAFAATVDWQVETGIDFLVPLGTTGETPTLSESEKLQADRRPPGVPTCLARAAMSILLGAKN